MENILRNLKMTDLMPRTVLLPKLVILVTHKILSDMIICMTNGNEWFPSKILDMIICITVRRHPSFHLFDKLRNPGNSINTRRLNNQPKLSYVKYIPPDAGNVKLWKKMINWKVIMLNNTIAERKEKLSGPNKHLNYVR